MGNKHPKNKTKDKAEKSKKDEEEDSDSDDVEEEAQNYWTISIIFELKNGTMTTPEGIVVNPRITLKKLKQDLKQLKSINDIVKVRRDNRNDDLGPEHLTLEALQLKDKTCLIIREE